MYYYRVNGHLCCSLEEGLPYEAVSCPESAKELIWLFAREPGAGRASFKVNDAALMSPGSTRISWATSARTPWYRRSSARGR